ncbi:peptide ABC transporter ATP-binding protein [Rothia kristinae]|nr:ABC transporter ATP-binding protein [Rothia kristinae]KTR32562.1 peptide ABC transporter ATP-binding protein [Rothia kristinae]KTR53756.1 peptide ABC transporter ATP-binding protein [Rothia kristinae]KTR67490.1 peptide ABC transporter ATP-binding protein [Rothia kristinae]KTR79487.1 peptide ABC transporter ATP-binding protein [Rothia kristinae]KTR81290.1 peptide ABC transporter ATP-binding protein [Rothia kristinae]
MYGTGPQAVTAVRGVDLEVAPGGFTAVMGPSGSGKSTLMHLMAGLETPTEGRVWIGGQEITGLSDAALTSVRRRRVGFIFQAFNLMPTMDVRENILLPFELDDRRPTAEQRQWIDLLLERLGLTGRVNHRPGELSGGQQQRVAIARALATRPALVLADEPTGNLDSRAAGEVLSLLQTAAQEMGQAILMVTHDPKAAAHADRVVHLADGRIVRTEGSGTPEQIAATMLNLEA